RGGRGTARPAVDALDGSDRHASPAVGRPFDFCVPAAVLRLEPALGVRGAFEDPAPAPRRAEELRAEEAPPRAPFPVGGRRSDDPAMAPRYPSHVGRRANEPGDDEGPPANRGPFVHDVSAATYSPTPS